MNYVMHFCRNKECNNGWIDKDLTNCKTFPPKWKYCKKCADKLGIDFDKQKPDDYLNEEEKNKKKARIEKMQIARQLKINSK